MKLSTLLAAALLLVAAPAAAGDIGSDPNVHVLHDYVLTMPKIKAYEAAYEALTTAAKADPSLKADIAAASSENDQTIAATIAKMDRHPRVYAFFQKLGLSKAEASLLPIILGGACLVAQYPQSMATMKAIVSQAQADFCKANMKAIMALPFLKAH